MIQSLSGSYSSFWTWIKHSSKKLKLGCRHFLLHLVSEIYHAFVIFFHNLRIRSCEEILPKNQFVKYSSNTKHITYGGKSTWIKLFIFYFQNFRCNIPSSAASNEQIFWLISKSRQIKINYFNFLLWGDKNIFRFEITMKNSFFRHISDCLKDLTQDYRNFIFWNEAFTLFFLLVNVLFERWTLYVF